MIRKRIISKLSKIICIIVSMCYMHARYNHLKSEVFCGKDVVERNRVISSNKKFSKQCVMIGGCLSRKKECLTSELPESRPRHPNTFSLSKIIERRQTKSLFCPRKPTARCGSNTTKSVCTQRYCCYYGDGVCGLPSAVAVRKKETEMFSIVITCFKQEKFLFGSISSVLQQQYSLWELIIVDDGSPKKKCFHYASKLVKKLKKLKRMFETEKLKILFKENTGLADTKTWASVQAKGNYICFLDASKMISPLYLYRAAKEIKENLNIGVLYGDQIYFDDDIRTDLWITFPRQVSEVVVKSTPSCTFPSIAIIKRDLFKIIEGYEAELIHGMEDFDLCLKIFRLKSTSMPKLVFKKLHGIQSWSNYVSNSMSRSVEYTRLALSLLRSEHNTLYNTLFDDIATIYCNKDSQMNSKLEMVVSMQNSTCSGRIWLALLKYRTKCNAEASLLLEEAKTACLSPTSAINKRDKAIMFKTMNNLLNSGTLSPNRPKLMHKCESYAKKILGNLASGGPKVRRFSLSTNITKMSDRYIAYFSKPNDQLLRSNARFANLLQHSVNRYANVTTIQTNIPNIFHFVYGFSGEKVIFEPYQFLSIYSAYVHNDPMKIYLHCPEVPTGKLWKKLSIFVELVIWKKENIKPPRCFVSYAHLSDYIRLLALYKYGGVYLDIDVLSFRKINRKINAEVGIPFQLEPKKYSSRAQSDYYGLCNAIILSVPRSNFLGTWIETYKFFRSSGKDMNWDEHSVRLPADIVDAFPSLKKNRFVAPLRSEKYFPLLWNETHKFLAEQSGCDWICHAKKWPEAEVFHLWTSSKNSTYADEINKRLINNGFHFSLISAIADKAKMSSKHPKLHFLIWFPILSTIFCGFLIILFILISQKTAKKHVLYINRSVQTLLKHRSKYVKYLPISYTVI